VQLLRRSGTVRRSACAHAGAGTGRPLYLELAARADKVGRLLAGRGLAFLLVENHVDSVAAYLGALRARVPVVLLAASLQAEHLARLLSVYRPPAVWLPAARAAEVASSRALLTAGDFVLLETGHGPVAAHQELALLMTTSGSTGTPKFVRQSGRNLTANAVAIAAYLELSNDDRPITTLPLQYVYGLSVVNSHLARGAAVVLNGAALTERRFWDRLRATKATSIAGVPYTYELLRRLRFGRMELPSLRVLTQAGGRLAPDLVAEFAGLAQQRQMRFFVMYGAAEATARMAYLPPACALEKPASIGIPIPGGELRIDGLPADEVGATGELVYRGPNVTMGYATCREDLTLGDERGGVLHTGDLARRDEDGFFYVVGRRDRFVKIFGNRVNLGEVEELLRAKGIDGACIGRDDLVRVFVTRESARDRVIAVLVEQTALHHSAFEVVHVDAIPRNASGKIT
jgi:acyl-CoA synthetase (AMP-forming)/AMP-acid ligase II